MAETVTRAIAPRNYPRWLIVLLVFAAAGLLEAVHGYVGYTLSGRPLFGYTLRGQPVSLPGMIARALPSWIVMGLCAGAALRITERRPLFSAAWKRSLLVHLPLAVLFTATFLVTAAVLRHYFFIGPEVGVRFLDSLLRYYTVYFNTIFLYYWGTVGVYSAFLYYRDLRERELIAEKLQRGLTEARLQALQQQVHPHFLFNTLNAISGLALSGDRAGTVRTLSVLGDLLRATLQRTDPLVTIEEELDFVARYAEILHVRFGDRLRIRTVAEPLARRALVPSFLLQPLVENAVRHGIGPETDAGWIEVAARLHGARVRLTVTDSGRGLACEPVRFGIGLRSCSARLEQQYGDSFTFEIRNVPDAGARVLIEYPCRLAARVRRSVASPDESAAAHPARSL
jgi:two-component system, LytTR family, sensor kinase